MNHVGTVTLRSERLILREFSLNDVQSMYDNWASDDDVSKYLTWPTHSGLDVTESIISSWVNDYQDPKNYHWGIVLADSHELIGSISLAHLNEKDSGGDIGYCIGKAYWNMGYVTEALKTIIEFFIEDIGLVRVSALHATENPASGRVMVKSGMTFEGTMRNYFKRKDGTFGDCNLYAITKEDYFI